MVKKVFTGGEKFRARLAEMAKGLTSGAVLETGYPEGVYYPDGTLMAKVAAIQEFGAPEANIPKRPFMKPTVENHEGEWADKLGSLLVLADYDAKAALQVLGEVTKSDLQDSIKSVMEPPLKPATIRAKGGNAKPLEDTKAMLDGVQSNVK